MASSPNPPDELLEEDPLAEEKKRADELHKRTKEALKRFDNSQKEFDRLTKMFHGDGSPDQKTLRSQAKSGQISAGDYYRMTGRIWAGAPQAKPNDLGTPGLDRLHSMNDPNRMPLGSDAATPGLDNLHRMNPYGTAQHPQSKPPPEVLAPAGGGPTVVGQTPTRGVGAPPPPASLFGPQGPQYGPSYQQSTPYGPVGVHFVDQKKAA